MREFMRRSNIVRACVLDSDIMLFPPIDRFVEEFEGCDIGNWSWATGVTLRGVDLFAAMAGVGRRQCACNDERARFPTLAPRASLSKDESSIGAALAAVDSELPPISILRPPDDIQAADIPL